jgi:hypothetical protein
MFYLNQHLYPLLFKTISPFPAWIPVVIGDAVNVQEELLDAISNLIVYCAVPVKGYSL